MGFRVYSSKAGTGTPRWLFCLLHLACALLLISYIFEMHAVIRAREALDAVVPAAYGSRMFMRPFILASVLLLLWWRFWAPEREGARVLALTAAFFLSVNWVALAINSSLGHARNPDAGLWLYPLCAVIFLIYTVAGRDG